MSGNQRRCPNGNRAAPPAAPRGRERKKQRTRSRRRKSFRRKVPEVGLEPTRDHLPLDFESSASANSATLAKYSAYYRQKRRLRKYAAEAAHGWSQMA